MNTYEKCYTVEQVQKITGLLTPQSSNVKYLYPAYLGKNLFDKEKVDNILEYRKYQKWFVQQITLFVEYLNKIELVSYEEIAKKVNVSLQGIATLTFSYNKAVLILVKFRKYTYGFDEYYG